MTPGPEVGSDTISPSSGWDANQDLGLGCRTDGSHRWSGAMDNPRVDVYRSASETSDIHRGHGQT